MCCDGGKTVLPTLESAAHNELSSSNSLRNQVEKMLNPAKNNNGGRILSDGENIHFIFRGLTFHRSLRAQNEFSGQKCCLTMFLM